MGRKKRRGRKYIPFKTWQTLFPPNIKLHRTFPLNIISLFFLPPFPLLITSLLFSTPFFFSFSYCYFLLFHLSTLLSFSVFSPFNSPSPPFLPLPHSPIPPPSPLFLPHTFLFVHPFSLFPFFILYSSFPFPFLMITFPSFSIMAPSSLPSLSLLSS